MYEFEVYTSHELRESCGKVAGYHVMLAPDADGGEFVDPTLGEVVAGTTRCVDRAIVVGDLDFAHNALVHEMGHAVTDCAGSTNPDDMVEHFGTRSATEEMFRAINAAGDVPMCF
jgi:hypothetical protein